MRALDIGGEFLVVPVRAEADGLRGDAFVRVRRDSPLGIAWAPFADIVSKQDAAAWKTAPEWPTDEVEP